MPSLKMNCDTMSSDPSITAGKKPPILKDAVAWLMVDCQYLATNGCLLRAQFCVRSGYGSQMPHAPNHNGRATPRDI